MKRTGRNRRPAGGFCAFSAMAASARMVVAVLALLCASAAAFGQATTSVALSPGSWTNLGVGPLQLYAHANNQATYAISATQPTVGALPKGFPIYNSPTLCNTISNCWAISVGPGTVTILVAPVQVAGGMGGSLVNQKTIATTGAPMIVPSSGTMGNNGALTLGTALPNTYSQAWFYMPAGAISASGAGSAANWYWGTCASTTVCTLYNSTYGSGTPLSPANPAAFATTGPGAYTQVTTTQVYALQAVIPAGTLGPYDGVEYAFHMGYPNTAGAKTLQALLTASGTTSLGTFNGLTTQQWSGKSGFRNLGNLNLQGPLYPNGMSLGTSNAAALYATVNTQTLAITLVISLTLATATDFVVLDTASFTFVPRGML